MPLLLLVKLLTLIKFTALVGELLFISGLAELALALLTLKIELIPVKGLVKLVVLISV